MSDSDSGLVHKGCFHESRPLGVVVVAVGTVVGTEVSPGVPAVLAEGCVDSAVLVATDVEPQAKADRTATRQNIISIL